ARAHPPPGVKGSARARPSRSPSLDSPGAAGYTWPMITRLELRHQYRRGRTGEGPARRPMSDLRMGGPNPRGLRLRPLGEGPDNVGRASWAEGETREDVNYDCTSGRSGGAQCCQLLTNRLARERSGHETSR